MQQDKKTPAKKDVKAPPIKEQPQQVQSPPMQSPAAQAIAKSRLPAVSPQKVPSSPQKERPSEEINVPPLQLRQSPKTQGAPLASQVESQSIPERSPARPTKGKPWRDDQKKVAEIPAVPEESVKKESPKVYKTEQDQKLDERMTKIREQTKETRALLKKQQMESLKSVQEAEQAEKEQKKAEEEARGQRQAQLKEQTRRIMKTKQVKRKALQARIQNAPEPSHMYTAEDVRNTRELEYFLIREGGKLSKEQKETAALQLEEHMKTVHPKPVPKKEPPPVPDTKNARRKSITEKQSVTKPAKAQQNSQTSKAPKQQKAKPAQPQQQPLQTIVETKTSTYRFHPDFDTLIPHEPKRYEMTFPKEFLDGVILRKARATKLPSLFQDTAVRYDQLRLQFVPDRFAGVAVNEDDTLLAAVGFKTLCIFSLANDAELTLVVQHHLKEQYSESTYPTQVCFGSGAVYILDNMNRLRVYGLRPNGVAEFAPFELSNVITSICYFKESLFAGTHEGQLVQFAGIGGHDPTNWSVQMFQQFDVGPIIGVALCESDFAPEQSNDGDAAGDAAERREQRTFLGVVGSMGRYVLIDFGRNRFITKGTNIGVAQGVYADRDVMVTLTFPQDYALFVGGSRTGKFDVLGATTQCSVRRQPYFLEHKDVVQKVASQGWPGAEMGPPGPARYVFETDRAVWMRYLDNVARDAADSEPVHLFQVCIEPDRPDELCLVLNASRKKQEELVRQDFMRLREEVQGGERAPQGTRRFDQIFCAQDGKNWVYGVTESGLVIAFRTPPPGLRANDRKDAKGEPQPAE